jgi:hypothetical protein
VTAPEVVVGVISASEEADDSSDAGETDTDDDNEGGAGAEATGFLTTVFLGLNDF